MTYTEAVSNYNKRLAEYNAAISAKEPQKNITRLSGRMIASLQALKRAAINEGNPNISTIEARLKGALNTHKGHLRAMDIQNRHGGNYSIIRELSIGVRDLVNSVNMRVNAASPGEKKAANKAIIDSTGKNLKNVVKAPIALTTKILKSSIVATVLFAPISLGFGILHAAWECMDKDKSPYEGKTVKKMSAGFTNIMDKVNSKVQSI